jgi:ADP-L-glycero-D-manno-heptose 6-epimerase
MEEGGLILVTGAAGMIGSALIHGLNRRGYHNILACDRLDGSERYRNLVALAFEDYVEADDLLAAISQGSRAFSQVHSVFHLGACAATDETDGHFLVKNNFEFTKILAEWALSAGARFVYASSAATYGDGSAGMEDDEAGILRLRPLNPYAFSKQLFDAYALRRGLFAHIYGLKYFNIFGPNEYHKGNMASMALHAFYQIRDTGKVRLFRSHRPEYADGCQRRDFLYVRDAVDMTLFLAQLPERDGEGKATGGIFNIGSGVASSWLELVRPIFAAMGVGESVEFFDMPEPLRHRYQYFTRANIDKLRRRGYEAPIAPLADAVSDYVSRYLMAGRRLGEE